MVWAGATIQTSWSDSRWLTFLIINSQQIHLYLRTHNSSQEVVYEGEAIGEIMQREDGAWINVYDDATCIGVWMTKEMAAIIRYTGSYKTQGDIIRIEGVFNKACPEHGGDLDIHATSLRTIKPGWVKQEKLVPAKRNLLIILSVILCLILILRIFITR